MTSWIHKYPLMHSPFNKKYVKLVQYVSKGEIRYKLMRATIADIGEAFGLTHAEAAELYRTGNSPRDRVSPPCGTELSRTRAREEG